MATPNSCVQWLSEESPVYEGANTAVTPYRISTVGRFFPVQSAEPTLGVQQLSRADEARGILGSYPSLIETYQPGASISMRCYLNDLVFLLQTCGLTDTVVQGDGSTIKDPDSVAIPTGAYRHVFTKRTGTTAKTAQLIWAYVEQAIFLKGNGFGTSGLTLNSQGDLGVTMEGLVLARVTDPNLTPAFDAITIPHVRRGDLTLTWLSGTGGTDDFTVSLANPIARRRSMNLATPSYFSDKLLFDEGQVALTGTVPMFTLAANDWDAIKSASTFAAKARWVTPVNIGATSYKYSMWIEMPACQLTEGSIDALQNRRRHGGSVSWFAAWDSVSGYDFKITCVCAQTAASLETLV